ncbi:hypothetical protein [Kiloniella laminariae]|uniref:PglD-related sugar-binding protein n=1 Tax=Kiloniella laminariae TaxID=454162 RepID=UPI000376FB1E|nr:hypothetical protein [Kiloniella laminariae]
MKPFFIKVIYMKKIVILGAGGFALELQGYISDCLAVGALTGEFLGFLDDTIPVGTHLSSKWGVLGGIVDHKPDPDLLYYIALGNPVDRRHLYSVLKAQGGEFGVLKHPSAYISSAAKLGEGAILCPFAFAGPLSQINENVLINIYGSVAHHSEVGKHSVLSPYATLNGHSSVGEAVFLGTSSVVTSNVSVGSLVKVAAGSVVYNNLSENAEAFGNPARVKKLT